jgi:DNA-binding IscR family transcriptional regulator
MDVIRLFEEQGHANAAAGSPAEATPVDHALEAVLSEIDQIAQATFNSITLSTMLRLVDKQAAQGRATEPSP